MREIKKEELKGRLDKLLSDFFVEEQGNRVTSNNIQGLIVKVNTILDELDKQPPSGN